MEEELKQRVETQLKNELAAVLKRYQCGMIEAEVAAELRAEEAVKKAEEKKRAKIARWEQLQEKTLAGRFYLETKRWYNDNRSRGVFVRYLLFMLVCYGLAILWVALAGRMGVILSGVIVFAPMGEVEAYVTEARSMIEHDGMKPSFTILKIVAIGAVLVQVGFGCAYVCLQACTAVDEHGAIIVLGGLFLLAINMIFSFGVCLLAELFHIVPRMLCRFD